MPNTGKPSRDCYLCRSRRVKCDLGRPQCQRCITYGVACPGYRDEQELVFRQVNPVTPEKRRQYQRQHEQYQRRKNAEALRRLSPESSDSLTPGTSTSPFSSIGSTSTLDPDPDDYLAGTEKQLSPSSPIPKSLTPHWTSASIPIVLNMYPAIHIIQNSYRQCDSDGPLVWVAHLLARTYIVNLRHPTSVDNDSVSESRKRLGNYWGKTLSAVSHILKEPEGPLRDDVLATIWLLANYELLIGSLDPDGPQSPWSMHVTGLYGILKSRPLRTFRNPKWRLTSFWPTYNLVQIQAIITTMDCPPETTQWLSVIRENVVPHECQLMATAAFVQSMTAVAAGIVGVIRSYDVEDAAEQYYLWIADMAAAQLAAEEDLLLSRGVETVSLRAAMECIRHAVFMKTCHLFTLLVQFLSHWPECPIPADDMTRQRDSCVLACRAAADSVLASIPELVGPMDPRAERTPQILFDAVRLIWPLVSVLENPSTLPAQRKECQRVMSYMANEMGIRQARITITPSWETLESCRRPDLFRKAI